MQILSYCFSPERSVLYGRALSSCSKGPLASSPTHVCPGMSGVVSRIAAWRGGRRVGILVLVLLFVVPIPALAVDDSAFEVLLEAGMPGLLDEYGVSGSVVSQITRGTVASTYAYGLANIETGRAMSPDMVFEFGSCGKVLTAWATMKLVEWGAIDLDTPVNAYLDRLQIESPVFDPNEVTVRRLLSHTSGLGIHGYLDYSLRRANAPGLVASLRGAHLLEGIVETLEPGGGLSFGRIDLVQKPGLGYRYSGTGYGVLQVLIEDVTGEPFDTFVQREITDPLGAGSLQWKWTPETMAQAPTPYGEEGQALEYRQLALQGIGSELGTVADFARFVAATTGGPNGEPPGRGVLSPTTIETMTTPDFEAGFHQGLGYPLGLLNGHRSVSHGGRNIGWEAFFILDTVSGDGFVVASNSNRAAPLHTAITGLFLDATYGPGDRTNSTPLAALEPLSLVFLAVSLALWVVLLWGLGRFITDLRSGRRARVARPSWRGLVRTSKWALALLFGWYTLYSQLTLRLPGWYPDLWPTTGSLVLMGTLVAGLVFSLASVFLPRLPVVGPDPTESIAEGSVEGAMGLNRRQGSCDPHHRRPRGRRPRKRARLGPAKTANATGDESAR